MRLIDADALIKEFLRLTDDEWNQKTGATWARGFEESAEVVEDAPTIDHAYGFPLEDLAFIARVMEKEGATPGEVAGLLRDAGRISEMVADVMQKAHEKSIREAVCRIDDDPSHPFADGVMMKE